jgi:hypothetical protein
VDKKLKLARAGQEAYNIVRNQVMQAGINPEGCGERAALLVRELAKREGFSVGQIEAEAQRISLEKKGDS